MTRDDARARRDDARARADGRRDDATTRARRFCSHARAGAATALGARGASAQNGARAIARAVEFNADARARASAAAAARARAMVAALRLGQSAGDDARRAAVEDATRAVDLVATSALGDVRVALVEASRERARARELAEELVRETRRRVLAETAARALRCALECERASAATSREDVARERQRAVREARDSVDGVDADAVRARDADAEDAAARGSPREASSESVSAAATGRRDDDDARDDAVRIGRDRRVTEVEARDSEWTAFVDAAGESDAATTHRTATLIMIELANAGARGSDFARCAREFFYKRHGSRALGEFHRGLFARSLARLDSSSAWARAFTRVHDAGDVDVEHALGLIRFTQFVLVESPEPECAPEIGVEEAIRALGVALAPLGESSPASAELEIIRRSATHRDGVSRVRLARVIESALNAHSRARDCARAAFETTFAERYPQGVLAHHVALTKVLFESVQSAGALARWMLGDTDVSATLDRCAVEIARSASSETVVERELFAAVAWRELERHRAQRSANTRREAPLRFAQADRPSISLECTTSLALVGHAWSVVSGVVDRWLAKWTVDAAADASSATAARAASNSPSIPIAQSTDANKRRTVRRHVDRVAKLRRVADYAARAAAALAKSLRPDVADDVRRAWSACAACACALEAAALAQRRAALADRPTVASRPRLRASST